MAGPIVPPPKLRPAGSFIEICGEDDSAGWNTEILRASDKPRLKAVGVYILCGVGWTSLDGWQRSRSRSGNVFVPLGAEFMEHCDGSVVE